MRAYDRILKLARTIADLAGSEEIQSAHLAEALHLRQAELDDGVENKGRLVWVISSPRCGPVYLDQSFLSATAL